MLRSAAETDGDLDANDLSLIRDDGETDDTPNSSVTFSGDFSFASRVFLHGDNDCGAADPNNAANGIGTDTSLATDDTNSPDLRMMEDDVIQGTTSAVNVTALGTAEYLCIMVQGEDTDDMMAPRINDKFNQRLYIVNRGPAAM